MKEYTIDVDKWRCGWTGENQIGNGNVRMLNGRGEMCCLGQISCQMGVDSELMLDTVDPEDVAEAIKNKGSRVSQEYLTHNPLIKYPRLGVIRNSKLASDAMDINDDDKISTKERAKRLKALFLKKGIKLRFKNIKKHL